MAALWLFGTNEQYGGGSELTSDFRLLRLTQALLGLVGGRSRGLFYR